MYYRYVFFLKLQDSNVFFDNHGFVLLNRHLSTVIDV